MSTYVPTEARKRQQKPALAECAMSLASTLLLGCQARGQLNDQEDPPSPPRFVPRPRTPQASRGAREKLAACR